MIAAIILFVCLCVFCGLGYYLNKKTPKPEGCEELSESCAGCKIKDCMHRVTKEEK